MSSDTPRTDACIAEYREGCLDFAWTLTDLARQLERGLAAMTAQADEGRELAILLIERAVAYLARTGGKEETK